jgi:hypothetical protein
MYSILISSLVLTLGFIVSQFEYRNFANAIAFYNVCSLFGRILSVSFANESLKFHLLMSTICCLTGVFFVICFGSILVIVDSLTFHRENGNSIIEKQLQSLEMSLLN